MTLLNPTPSERTELMVRSLFTGAGCFAIALAIIIGGAMLNLQHHLSTVHGTFITVVSQGALGIGVIAAGAIAIGGIALLMLGTLTAKQDFPEQ